MDAGSILQENVSTTLFNAFSQLECCQVDELACIEDDLQVVVANQDSGSCRFDKVCAINLY